MSQKRLLEIACFNLESALIAEAAGADRIELCEDYASGGVTPSETLIVQARRKVKIPLHVIIRPRGGNFCYDDTEKALMIKHILFCKASGIDGIVMGCLTPGKKIDQEFCKELIALSRPMRVTFHRAIDACEHIEEEMEKLAGLGVDRVLTSGGKQTALEGKEILHRLEKRFGTQLIILPGGGIRSSNIDQLVKTTTCSEFHSAALLNNSLVCDAEEIRSLKEKMRAA